MKSAVQLPDRKTLRRLVVEQWERLKRPPIDARVLATIEAQVRKQHGNGASSPAAIARILADEGAELRHPQIIERDVAWRESTLDDSTREFASMQQLLSGEPLNLIDAEELIKNLEVLREKFEREESEDALRQLKALAVQARQAAQSLANNRGADEQLRATQSEIVEWLKVWLQTPGLFRDWLELRRRTEEFRRKFGIS